MNTQLEEMFFADMTSFRDQVRSYEAVYLLIILSDITKKVHFI